MAVCAGLLEPIVKQMHRQILQSRVSQTDDTPVTVLDKVKGRYQGRLWIHLGDRDHPHVVFDFTTDRSGAGPERMLKGYQGYLQADAYSAYDRLYAGGTIVEVGCWMHARRKFFEAKTSDPLRSHQALAWIRGLYAVEREAKTKELDDAQRLTLRQEQSRPILETIKEWLDKEVGQDLPKSPMAEAIGYALNHWKALERYLEVGFLEIDNGASERGLRPVAVGRNNWLFVGSEAGGKTAAILMSLCATCKRVGIDPLAYLRDVLERISTHPASRIAELVPEQWRKIRAGPDQGESPSTSADP
jgi:transposase